MDPITDLSGGVNTPVEALYRRVTSGDEHLDRGPVRRITYGPRLEGCGRIRDRRYEARKEKKEDDE